jgi:hypothetical protein
LPKLRIKIPMEIVIEEKKPKILLDRETNISQMDIGIQT